MSETLLENQKLLMGFLIFVSAVRKKVEIGVEIMDR
jgi:hypothetical protein